MAGGRIGIRGDVVMGVKVKVMQGGVMSHAHGQLLEGGKGTQTYLSQTSDL